MECPNCGSDAIHRSKRHGPYEKLALTAVGVFPYRCSDCRTRFRRFHPDRRGDVRAHVDRMPEWLGRLLWAVVAVALGVAACLFLVTRIAGPGR